MTTLPTPPPPPKIPPYLSYVGGRRENFKTHNNIGHVKNAIGHFISDREGGIVGQDLFVWEVKNGEYEIMWNIPAGTKNTELPWAMKIRQPYKAPHIQCKCPNCKS